MNEVSLFIRTPRGGVLVVGCSHPGIERIVEAAAKIDPQIHAVFGGFHLVDMPDARVTEMVTSFRDKWKIERMAAGHCTGPFAFAEMIRLFEPAIRSRRRRYGDFLAVVGPGGTTAEAHFTASERCAARR